VADLHPTSPQQCGLALALPMNLAAIGNALSGGAYADYVGRAAALGPAYRIWEAGFRRVAAMAEELKREAAGLGVVVVDNASLQDLRTLFSSCSVVTIVAHWRGPEIAASDVKLDAAAIVDRIVTERSPLADLMRANLPAGWSEKVRAAQPSARFSWLAEILDRRLGQPPPLLPPPQGGVWHMDPMTLRHFNRAALDSWWPEAFVAANRLELADGQHAADSIADCIDADWSGIVDLSNCQSAQMIDCIKQSRPSRLIIANEQETDPISRMAVLRIVYDLLRSGTRNYASVRKEFASAIAAETRGR
jgi:hypothetical protein